MSEPAADKPVERVSPTAQPQLTKTQLDERIKQRRAEMNAQPCYRCAHSLASPATDCACCRAAHTPDADGNFKEDA